MLDTTLLQTGIYTVPDVARLVDAPPQRVRGWVAGYPRTKAGPLLDNDLGWAGDQFAMSFTNLMEVRFIAKFSAFGVRVQAIRAMLAEAKELLRHPHPFATAAIFKTDGRKIFAEVADATGDSVLYDLKAKNWAMHGIVAQSLMKDVEYDPGGDPLAWRPRKDETPKVVIRPEVAFGRPTLEGTGIPTRVLFDAFFAEGETEESVARWYGVKRHEVRQAVKFETLLKRAA
jgi:uncharacterized protein (DUF433 family)